MKEPLQSRLIAYLSSFVTPERLHKMRSVLAERTRYITVALEDIYQPHNASAVLRSCDGFGIQDVHIIENRNTYEVNPKVELGTKQWLSLTRYNRSEENTSAAVESLRKRGYRIVATSPHARDVNLEEFDLSRGKAAFFFGNELDGLSRLLLDSADEYMKIPMFGFVESFNISVSCALTLHHLVHSLRASDIDWHITEAEHEVLLLQWLRNSIKNCETIERKFFEEESDQ
ncbi:MAG: RNA methyltransferase [Spirochaetota bacterium]|nr:RNA methyltransferase [Spirochaetota bacterium]